MDFEIFRFFFEFEILEFLVLDFWREFEIRLICVVFFCCFVCCLFVLLGFWYTFVVSTIFLRVAKTESDFRCTEKAEFTGHSFKKIVFVLLLLALPPQL